MRRTVRMSKNRLERLLLVSYNMRRASYIIRGIAGAYVVYLMYQLFSESSGSAEALTAPMIAAGVAMIVAGVYFVISAAYGLLKGIYAENDPAQVEHEDAAAGETPEIKEE
jgi:TRAP-type C4-dicarboxylate transport system permease small subunit